MAYHYTEEQLIEALQESRGVVAVVARKLGCDWITARRHIDKHPAAKEVEKAEREALCDQCEATMIGLLKSDEDKVRFNAAAFYLERLGKYRGFNVRQEVEMVGQPPVVVDDIPRDAVDIKLEPPAGS